MTEPLSSLILLLAGAALCRLALYIVRLYRSSMRNTPQQTMTQDIVFVLLLGTWAVPVILAALVMYLGIALLVFGTLFGWWWLTD